jgi:hypothetical protein
MRESDLSEQIRDLGKSASDLLKAFTSEESKRNGFATIEEYVDATRYRTESVDGSRAEYYTFALNKLREQDDRVGTSQALHFISTLNTNCSVVDIGAGPVVLIDLYQSQVLEDMARLFLAGGPANLCGAMGLRLLAEHLIASGKQELATHFAVRRSILINECEHPEPPIIDETELEKSSAVQDVFVLTHEIAHVLWSRRQVPAEFPGLAAQWIHMDTFFMAETQLRIAGAPEAEVHAWLLKFAKSLKDPMPDPDIVSFPGFQNAKSAYAPDQLRSTIERRCNPSSGFIEEVWADFYSWISCMRLFFQNWAAQQVYRDMTLALRSLAAIDAMRRIAENTTDQETIDEASTRRCVLRIGLRTMLGDFRKDDDFGSSLHLTTEDFAVDFARIGVETEDRFNKVLWNPMFFYGVAAARSTPVEQELTRLYARCEEKFGANPALTILRDNPIDDSNLHQLFGKPPSTSARSHPVSS